MSQDLKQTRGGEKMEKSKIEAPEKVQVETEKVAEQQKTNLPVDKEKQVEKPVLKSTKPVETELKPEKDDMTLKIEKVLEDDLKEVYLNLSSEQQEEFKKKGEKTASAIRELMESLKDRAQKIVELITDWLKIIPNASKFFIEQEAKIKADKILNIKNPK